MGTIRPEYYGKPDSRDDLIDFGYRHGVGPLEFNVMKYVMRHGKKNGLEDLRKAEYYLKRLIEYKEQEVADAQKS